MGGRSKKKAPSVRLPASIVVGVENDQFSLSTGSINKNPITTIALADQIFYIGVHLSCVLQRETFNMYRSMKLTGIQLYKADAALVQRLVHLNCVHSGTHSITLIPVETSQAFIEEALEKLAIRTRKRALTRERRESAALAKKMEEFEKMPVTTRSGRATRRRLVSAKETAISQPRKRVRKRTRTSSSTNYVPTGARQFKPRPPMKKRAQGEVSAPALNPVVNDGLGALLMAVGQDEMLREDPAEWNQSENSAFKSLNSIKSVSSEDVDEVVEVITSGNSSDEAMGPASLSRMSISDLLNPVVH